MEEKENTENAEMGKRKHSHDTKIVIKYYYERIRQNTRNFLKWMGLSVLTGLVVGGASAVFAGCIKAATEYRDTHNWIFMLLPVAGVLIVFMYEKIGRQDGGTNQVLATIKSKDDVPFLSAPLIFVSTLLTHLTGGSAGREGASIQFGGSIGNWLGKLAHLDEFDHHVMIMCGMSAAFAAVFGTPMAAAVFAMEVVSVGVMYYAALLPCVIASIIAAEFATGMGIDPETFPVHSIPGHVPLNQVAANMEVQKSICMGAPFYVLGPLVTDIAPGYDHITAAIGGAVAAASGAAFLCYVTPAEHLALPNVDDVKQGIVASKIAAHAADIAKGIPHARDIDDKMGDARRVLDWDAQFACALDPETAKAIRDARLPEDDHSDTCSMCGKFCAVRSMNKALAGEYIDIL